MSLNNIKNKLSNKVMYELLFIVVLVSQLQNLSVIYAVEIQLFKQKIQQHTNKMINRTKYFVKWIHEYFYPPQKEVKEEKKVVLYEDKYKEFPSENLPTKPNNILIEQTPIGNVIMFYNSRFEFYADKTIPYRFLETVARKYVITFKCKDIYTQQTRGKDKQMNQFLYLGKIANFSFLKKVEKHITNKKINMTFKEFKTIRENAN